MQVLVFGATGALGRPLVDALVGAGHGVTGTSRSAGGVARLVAAGARGVQVDALDPTAVRAVVDDVAPGVVINQLTGMPQDPMRVPEVVADDLRVRREGHRNVLDAAVGAGVRRLVQQTTAFMLDGGGAPAPDGAPHRADAPEGAAEYVDVWTEVERGCADTTDLETVVLRYGFVYGPGTWYGPDGASARAARDGEYALVGDGTGVWSFLHVEDAASATVAALDAPTGTYNVVDDDPVTCAEWIPAFVRAVGGPGPRRVPAPPEDPEGGDFTQNRLDGATNRRARDELGLRPRRLEWLDRA